MWLGNIYTEKGVNKKCQFQEKFVHRLTCVKNIETYNAIKQNKISYYL